MTHQHHFHCKVKKILIYLIEIRSDHNPQKKYSLCKIDTLYSLPAIKLHERNPFVLSEFVKYKIYKWIAYRSRNMKSNYFLFHLMAMPDGNLYLSFHCFYCRQPEIITKLMKKKKCRKYVMDYDSLQYKWKTVISETLISIFLIFVILIISQTASFIARKGKKKRENIYFLRSLYKTVINDCRVENMYARHIPPLKRNEIVE